MKRCADELGRPDETESDVEVSQESCSSTEPVCKRYKVGKSSVMKLRRAHSDGILFNASQKKDTDQDDLATKDPHRSMGLDISVRLFRAMAMGLKSVPLAQAPDVSESSGEGEKEKQTPAENDDVSPNGGRTQGDGELVRVSSPQGMISVCKENDVNMYKCKICGVSFNDLFDIDIHLRIHRGVPSMRALTTQQKTLQGNTQNGVFKVKGRPYRCLVCSRRFKLPKSLLAHVEGAHSAMGTSMPQDPSMTLQKWQGEFEGKEKLTPVATSTKRSLATTIITDTPARPFWPPMMPQPSGPSRGILTTPLSHLSALTPEQRWQTRPTLPYKNPVNLRSFDSAVSPDINDEMPLDFSLKSNSESPYSKTPGMPVSVNDMGLTPTNFSLQSLHDSHASPDSQMGRSVHSQPPRTPELNQLHPYPQQPIDSRPPLPYEDQFDVDYSRRDLQHAHANEIQDPAVSSDTTDYHADATQRHPNIAHFPSQQELEKQFFDELDLVEMKLRRKYEAFGLRFEDVTMPETMSHPEITPTSLPSEMKQYSMQSGVINSGTNDAPFVNGRFYEWESQNPFHDFTEPSQLKKPSEENNEHAHITARSHLPLRPVARRIIGSAEGINATSTSKVPSPVNRKLPPPPPLSSVIRPGEPSGDTPAWPRQGPGNVSGSLNSKQRAILELLSSPQQYYTNDRPAYPKRFLR